MIQVNLFTKQEETHRFWKQNRTMIGEIGGGRDG